MIFLAGLTILKKVRCLGIVGGCGANPAVALHLRNAAEYRLFYFSTTWHDTRAYLISVNHRGDFAGWFDNSKKGEMSGQIEWMGG